MRVSRQPLESVEPLAASVVTVGNFDGVHRAHQELFRRVVETARSKGVSAVVLSFEPHPARILAPSRAPQILTPSDLKIRLIAEQGADVLWILPFTAQVAELSPDEFVEQAICRALRAQEVHVGANFRFGHNRQGTVDLLAALGRAHGFAVRVLPVMNVRGQPVSSSRVRALLADGRITMASRLLGRPYAVAGRIEAGEGRGRRLTVPTLNLGSVQQQLPKVGVYVTRTTVGARIFESVTNVGYQPTFGQHQLTVESHLLNFSGEVAADRMEIQFLYRLRDEMKFPCPDALKAQIGKDAHRALRYFHLWRLFVFVR
jgi:riboflavin kinase/FMN adenylyltransferase